MLHDALTVATSDDFMNEYGTKGDMPIIDSRDPVGWSKDSGEPLVVLNLGGGVQSSTLALMALHNEIQRPHCCIFADTGAEPMGVYRWVRHLQSLVWFAFPIYSVMHQNGILHNLINSTTGSRYAGAPFFTESKNRRGMLRRTCTSEFKAKPIVEKVRSLLGLAPGQRYKGRLPAAIHYIGISTDEASRMKPAPEKYLRHTWPLIDAGMSRHDCNEWMKKRGYPAVPKSACTFCPYRSDPSWRLMRDTEREGWEQAVKVDQLIRSGVRGTTQKLFVHGSLKPLNEVDFSTEEDRGQLNMFENECEGMCGV